MTIEITGRASSHHDNADVSVTRELVQSLGEHVTHLAIEIDALCAAQFNDGNSIGYSGRENIGVRLRHNHLLPGSTICYRMTSCVESFEISRVL